MQHQEVVFGVAGQQFVYDPPEGRPATSPAPTVSVSNGEHTVSATSGECAVDSVQTALRYDVRQGATRLVLADATGVAAGRRYLLRDSRGGRERIDVASVRHDAITLRHPVVHAFEAGTEIVGCRISVAVAPEWAADESNLSDRTRCRGVGLAAYRLRWTYMVDGFEMSGVSFADLVAHAVSVLVTPSDLEERFPGWLGSLPHEHRANQGADFIAEAFQAVRLEAVGDDFATRRVRETAVARELVKIRAHLIRLEHDVMHGVPRADELEAAQQRYRASYAKLVASPQPREVARREVERPAAFATGTAPGSEKSPLATSDKPDKPIVLPTPFPPKLTNH